MALRSPHILVVGAGIVGASVAWHLAREGSRVTLLGSGSDGGLATPRSWAWINASWGNPEPYFRLRVRSMALWRAVEKEIPELALDWCGGLIWDLAPDSLARFAAEHAAWGYGIRRVERDEILRIEPALARAPDYAFHVAEEGAVEPAEAARAFAAAAVREGATVLKADVLSVHVEGGRAKGVETSAGLVRADLVVLAAGAGTAPLAASVDVTVPLGTPPGLLVSTQPIAKVLNGLVMAPELHVRQTKEGRLLAGSDFAGTDPGEDPDKVAEELFASMRTAIRPDIAFAPSHHTVGYRPTPVDGFPIVGAADRVPGLFIAVTHSGVTLAPAIGRMLTEQILRDRRDPLLAPYGLGRFEQAVAA